MQSVWEEFLAWLAQSVQTILDVAPDTASQIASQSANAFYQLKIIVGIEVPRFVGRFTPADLLVLTGLICLILGIRMRLYYRGVFLYLFGLASLIVGLGNIVNPAGLPLLLRV